MRQPRRWGALVLLAAFALLLGLANLQNGRHCDPPSTPGAPSPVPAGEVWLLAVTPAAGSSAVYVATPSGTYVSHDRGATWERSGAGGSVLAIDPRHPEVRIAAGGQSLLTTADGGTTWAAAKLPSCTRPLDGAAMSSDLRVAYAWGSGSIFEDEHVTGGLFRTTNAGSSFRRIAPWTPTHVAVDPRDASSIYAATPDGLFKTTSGGGSWRKLTRGLTDEPVQVTVAPSDPRVLYVIASTSHHVAAGNGEGGPTSALVSSSDGGATWHRRLELFVITSVAVDPHNAQIAYVWGERLGRRSGTEVLLTTSDGGRRWRQRFALAGGGTPTVSDPGSIAPWEGPGAEGVVMVDPHYRSTLYRQTRHGVVRTTDAGRTWRPLDVP
jgi:photosystem II stability/assembly factor-like uncharacterized protein